MITNSHILISKLEKVLRKTGLNYQITRFLQNKQRVIKVKK